VTGLEHEIPTGHLRFVVRGGKNILQYLLKIGGTESGNFILREVWRDVPLYEDIPDPLERTVRSLKMTTRTTNALVYSSDPKIITVRDLTLLSDAELLRLPNFGRKSLNEVKEVLAELNLKLRDHHQPTE
jgi:DNA-directed RNA polymerase alpha subunit